MRGGSVWVGSGWTNKDEVKKKKKKRERIALSLSGHRAVVFYT